MLRSSSLRQNQCVIMEVITAADVKRMMLPGARCCVYALGRALWPC
jgi:hypothetical protein